MLINNGEALITFYMRQLKKAVEEKFSPRKGTENKNGRGI